MPSLTCVQREESGRLWALTCHVEGWGSLSPTSSGLSPVFARLAFRAAVKFPQWTLIISSFTR